MCDTEVGENGVFAGGGVLGGANAVALSDDDGDGVWEATVPMEAGTSGNYAFFNSPSASDDWNTKEVLTGQACADPNNYDDRILIDRIQNPIAKEARDLFWLKNFFYKH